MEEYRVHCKVPDQYLEGVSSITEDIKLGPYWEEQIARDFWGEKGYRLYHTLYGMVQRCYNPKGNGYEYYGARGIEVCDEWRKDIAAFIRWALENGYKPGLSIHRVDNDGDYEPSNCVFISRNEHAKLHDNLGKYGKK